MLESIYLQSREGLCPVLVRRSFRRLEYRSVLWLCTEVGPAPIANLAVGCVRWVLMVLCNALGFGSIGVGAAESRAVNVDQAFRRGHVQRSTCLALG